MLGAIIGDIVGSRFEFDNARTKDFELFTNRCSATDDSFMTLAIAKAIMSSWQQIEATLKQQETPGKSPLDSDVFISLLTSETVHKMQDFGRRYPSSYGGRFLQWIQTDEPKPYNSFGNGAAMRVSSVAYIARNEEELLELAKAVTAVTHNHPEGIKGAQATALAIYLALHGHDIETIRERIQKDYYALDFTLDEIRQSYQFNETCQDTVPQAIQAFLESNSFEDAIRNAISIGGDSDTLGAITGSIAEAYYTVPEEIGKKALTYLDDNLNGLYKDWLRFLSNNARHLGRSHGALSISALVNRALKPKSPRLKKFQVDTYYYYPLRSGKTGCYTETLIIDDEANEVTITKKGLEQAEIRHQYQVLKGLDRILKAAHSLLAYEDWVDAPIRSDEFFKDFYQLKADYADGNTIHHQGPMNRAHLPENAWYTFSDLMNYFMYYYGRFGIFDKGHILSAIKPGEIKLCNVVFRENGRTYQYQTDNPEIIPWHYVLVPVGDGGTEKLARVESVRFVKSGDEIPYPLEKTKHIIRIVEGGELNQYNFPDY